MVLDNEQQRELIMQAFMALPIQGDLGGIIESIPKYMAVLEAVKNAEVKEVDNGQI